MFLKKINIMKIVIITLVGLLFGLLTASSKEAEVKKFEFIGLEFGVKLNHKITEGPRGAPAIYPELKEFYQIQYENFDFDKVFVALTKNEISNETEFKFNQEGIIWAALFSSNAKKGEREMFNESDFTKIVNFIEKKYGAAIITKDNKVLKSELDLGPPSLIFSATLIANNVFFDLRVTDFHGNFGEKVLVIKNFGVMRECGNEAIKKDIDKNLNHFLNVQKTRIN